jgi:succinyl-CoA synthetase beta subunit
MNLHEYQAKSLFAKYGLPVPKGSVTSTAEGAARCFEEIAVNGSAVAKCQIHAGGRGKAGGVQVVRSKDEARNFATRWLGSSLVTFQTNSKGQPVNRILFEECQKPVRELYLGATIDRSIGRVVVMASTKGGMEIEKVAAETPELIFREIIDPTNGAQPYQGRELAFRLGLTGDVFKQFVSLFIRFCRIYHECDCSLMEVNPLVITDEGKLLCLDAKMNVDNNALYRQPEIKDMRDFSQEPEIEARAMSNNLNYVALDGNIGCMVNGAGLAMGTMDLIKLHGGEPANFLDVGGSATRDRVVKAFEIILSDTKVKVIFVNIFGGIVRCDLIAEGIIGAVEEVGLKIPVVVRLEGNGAEKGRELLSASGFDITACNDLTEAVKAAVAAVKE